MIKDGKKEGYVSDPDERDEELDEMTKGSSFIDIELDAAVLQVMFSQGIEQEREHGRLLILCYVSYSEKGTPGMIYSIKITACYAKIVCKLI